MHISQRKKTSKQKNCCTSLHALQPLRNLRRIDIRSLFIIALVFLQTSCTGVPKGVVPIDNFDQQKYLGKWYEIARLDHSFEKGLSHVTAEYTIMEDGGIKVLNKGYTSKDKQWKEAQGKAYFVGNEDLGHLKVSFFGPFYGSYVIFKIDNIDYQYSYVTSHNKDFLWLLSRTPTISDAIKNDFIQTTKNLGFKISEIIFVNHKPSNKDVQD